MLTSKARSAPLLPIALTLGVLALVPSVSQGSLLFAATLGLIYAIAGVGLDIFSGYGGQLSFGHFGFVAIGAYTSASLSTDYAWNVWLTLPASILAAAVIGAVLSIPTVKVADLGTALITFFFAYLVHQLLSGRTLAAVTHSADGIAVAQATIFGRILSEPITLFYVSLACLVVVCIVSWRYANSRSGVALRVVKRSKVVAASNGIPVNRARRFALTYSAGVAGLAGFLLAQASAYLSPEGFGPLLSVNLMAMVVLGGMGSVVGPIFGSLFFALVTQYSLGSSALAGAIFPTALLFALIVLPDGIYGLGERVLALTGGRGLPRKSGARPPHSDGPVRGGSVVSSGREVAQPGDGELLLTTRDVTVEFGGVVALSGVSTSIRGGIIHAVMGPNGAGKTTLLNCVSGVQPHQGTVSLEGKRLTGLSSDRVRALGVTRTFQSPSLVADLSVLENVAIGAQRPLPWWALGGLLPSPAARKLDRAARYAAGNALDLLEFPVARRQVLASGLSLAEQKMVDVARAVAGNPVLVLLDEPTAGLDEHEMQTMANALETVRATGITIMVIAHHVDFLRRLADCITVLNFGQVIASGTPEEVLAQQQVIDIYLGAAHV